MSEYMYQISNTDPTKTIIIVTIIIIIVINYWAYARSIFLYLAYGQKLIMRDSIIQY